MSVRLLRKAVKETVAVEKVVKPDLVANVCDLCGHIFSRIEVNGTHFGRMEGVFDRGATDEHGTGLGNMFHAEVCSYLCAEEIHRGMWRFIQRYRAFAHNDAVLIRTTLSITEFKTEKQLVDVWNEQGTDNNQDQGDEQERGEC